MTVLERLARIDGPVAWVVWNLNAGFSAGGQPRVSEAGPDARFCLVPRSAVTVLDTWQAAGMRGTGSNTVIADDVAVPPGRAVKPAAAPRIDRPLFRVPVINQITAGGAAVLLGMAQAAIDEVVALSAAKTGPDGLPLAHQPRVQAAVGQAAARLGAAWAYLLATVGALDDAAAGRRPAAEAERGAMRGALCHAGETVRAVLTSMYEAGGSSVLYDSSRLGRIFRDGHAGAQHAIFSAAHYEVAGRTVIGLPAGDPSL